VGSFVFGRLFSRHGESLGFHALTAVLYWILTLPWLLVGSGDSTLLIFSAMFLSGIGYGLINVIQFTIAMRLCPASIEGFMFCTLMSFANIGEYALGANVITSLAGPAGGLIPAFFTLVPLSLLGFFAIARILAPSAKGPGRQADEAGAAR
jgi:MFS family permease